MCGPQLVTMLYDIQIAFRELSDAGVTRDR